MAEAVHKQALGRVVTSGLGGLYSHFWSQDSFVLGTVTFENILEDLTVMHSLINLSTCNIFQRILSYVDLYKSHQI